MYRKRFEKISKNSKIAEILFGVNRYIFVMKNKIVAKINQESGLNDLLNAMQKMGNPFSQMMEIMDDIPAILSPENAQDEMTGRVRTHQARKVKSGLSDMSIIVHRIEYMDQINAFIDADLLERESLINIYVNAGDENARYEMELIKDYLIEQELNELAKEMQSGINKVIVKLTKSSLGKILSAETSDRLDATIFFKRYPAKMAVPTLQMRHARLREEIMNKEIEIEESASSLSLFSLDSLMHDLLKEELKSLLEAIDACEKSSNE